MIKWHFTVIPGYSLCKHLLALDSCLQPKFFDNFKNNNNGNTISSQSGLNFHGHQVRMLWGLLIFIL